MDYTSFPASLSSCIESVSVLNYDAEVFTEILQNELNPHAAARRSSALKGFEEQLRSLGEEWFVKHTTTLNEQAVMDNLYLTRRTYGTYLMECSIMAATLEPSLPTFLGIDETVPSARKDVLDLYAEWYKENARSLSDQFFQVTSEMICIAVATCGKGVLVKQGGPNPRSPYPSFRVLFEQSKQPPEFAVAFSFIAPKKMLLPRR